MKDNISAKKIFYAKAALLLTAIMWGSGFIASQLALDAQLSSPAIMLGRFAIASLLIFCIFSKSIMQNMKREHLKSGLIIGVLLFGAFIVQTLGLKYSTPSNNAFITAANVVMVPFLWWVISKKKPRGIIFLASALCLFGVGVLSVDLQNGISLRFGDLLTLLSAFLFACHITATGIFAAKMDHRVLVFLQFSVAALCALVVFLLTDRDFSAFLQPHGIASLFYLGAFSTCLCFFLQTVAQKYVISSTAAIILSTEALFGSFFSVLAGYDSLSLRLITGGIIVFFSVIIPDLWQRRNEKNGGR